MPKTQLQLTATPGRRFSFSAKTESVVTGPGPPIRLRAIGGVRLRAIGGVRFARRPR